MKGSDAKRSGATYSRRRSPARAAFIDSRRTSPGSIECSAAARIPRLFSSSTWSFISEISGDTTNVVPGSRTAGS